VLPALHASVEDALVSLLLDEADELELAGLFDVVVVVAAGAHAASMTMLMTSKRLKMVFRFICFLHL
jgi:hypothetical protein